MLISRRKEGETLSIGDEIEIRVVSVRGKKAILGVVAPRDLKISAGRLTPEAMANTMAAVHVANIDNLLHLSSKRVEAPVLLLQKVCKTNEVPDDKQGEKSS